MLRHLTNQSTMAEYHLAAFQACLKALTLFPLPQLFIWLFFASLQDFFYPIIMAVL